MKINLGVFVLLLTITIHSVNCNSIISYIVQVQEETRQDFLELTITTTASDKSLEKAISLAYEKAEKIKELKQDVCKRLVKDKSQCKGSAEIGNVEISPKYTTQKKQTIFDKITASFTTLIKVQHVDKFGQLVDQILKMEGFIIQKIEWIADQDQIQETFLTQGLEKSKQLCAQLNQNFIRIIQVEQIREQPEEPEEQQPAQGQQEEEEQEEQQPEQQPQQQEQEVTKYRITVECGGSKKKQNKKQKVQKKYKK